MIAVEPTIFNIISVICGMISIIFGNYILKKDDDKNIPLIKNKGFYLLILGVIIFYLPIVLEYLKP